MFLYEARTDEVKKIIMSIKRISDRYTIKGFKIIKKIDCILSIHTFSCPQSVGVVGTDTSRWTSTGNDFPP